MLRHRTAALVRGSCRLKDGWGVRNTSRGAHFASDRHHRATCAGPAAARAPALLQRLAVVRNSASSSSSSSPARDAAGWRQSLPFAQTIEFDGQHLEPSRVAELLGGSITAERISRIDKVVSNRTFDVVPVVEGLYDMGNLAAVCRSADALGFGAIHVITKGDKYKKSQRTSAGADKWLHVTAHGSTEAAVAHLKARGFQLVVTHLGPASVSIQDVDWTRPTAVVLGNEAAGVSPEMVAAADVCAVIPMAGFVESFNISVAGALVLYEARRRRQEVLGHNADLSAEEQEALRAHLMLRALKNSGNMLRNLLARPPPDWQEARFNAALARRQQLAAAAVAKQAALADTCSSSSSSSSSSGDGSDRSDGGSCSSSADSSSSHGDVLAASRSSTAEGDGLEGREQRAASTAQRPGPTYSSRL